MCMRHNIRYIFVAIVIVLQLITIAQLYEIKHTVDQLYGLCGSIWERMDDQDIKWYQWMEEYRQNEEIVTED